MTREHLLFAQLEFPSETVPHQKATTGTRRETADQTFEYHASCYSREVVLKVPVNKDTNQYIKFLKIHYT